jgi:pilus assembly protein CpaF
MTMMSNIDIPLIAIRRYIASTLEVIVQQQHMEDNTRKTVSITEVCGMEGNVIQLQELFRYEQEGVERSGRVRGRFVCTGVRPSFMNKIRAAGIAIPDSIFEA